MRPLHRLLCTVVVALAALLVIAGPGGAAVAGVGLAVLLCPIVMGIVMWLLMRQPHGPGADRGAGRAPNGPVGWR